MIERHGIRSEELFNIPANINLQLQFYCTNLK